MRVSSTSPGLVQPAPLSDNSAPAPTTAQPGFTASSGPAAIVTLSQDAKDVLAQQTSPLDPAQALREQLSQAAATLSDTSGSVSTDDQFQAFKMISQTLLHGPAGGGEADPNLQFASALVDSPFAQRLNQVFAYMASQNTITSSADPFAERAKVDARTLAAFDGLSQADQQLYVSAQAFHTQTTYELPWVHQSGAIIQSPDEFHANLQAQVQIDQALGAAIDDPRYATDTLWNGRVQNDANARVLALGKLAAAASDQQMVDLTNLQYYRNSVDWTAKATAYLEKYGSSSARSSSGDGTANPAPAPFVLRPTAPNPDTQKFLGAIATLNDPKASIDAKMAALDVKPLRSSPASAWVLSWMSERSAFSKEVDRASSALMNHMMSVGRNAQAGGRDVPPNGAQLTLDYLDSRSGDDQRLIARGYGYRDVATWKSELQSQAAAFADQYPARAAATKADDEGSTALKTLKQVSARQKQFVETERAKRLGDDGATDDQAKTPVDPESAKALETLSQIIDTLQSFAEAERARRAGEESRQQAQSLWDKRLTPGARIDKVA